jgi:regulator of replication initiation timing
MTNETLITVLTALVSAFGVKEIWAIWKKKIDLKAKKEDKVDDLYLSIIKDLKAQIQKLEVKVDTLIKENVELREEIAKHKISDKPLPKRNTKRTAQTQA